MLGTRILEAGDLRGWEAGWLGDWGKGSGGLGVQA